MPYQRAQLSDEEIDILKKWIDQGAKWGKHWAYEPVKAPELPSTFSTAGLGGNDAQAQAPIDFFVQEQLTAQGLTPAPKEDPMRLLRRVALDITGLPPTEALAKDFSAGKITYEQAVDQLLNAEAYGEKWATWWLDLARYADTKGYERDVSRTFWPYRDWVIRSLNADKPFDQFTVEQLAGRSAAQPHTGSTHGHGFSPQHDEQ